MALKKKPVTGMKDILPREMEIRDYVIQMIKDTYKTYGFMSMETPCVEHIENLCSKQGGDNEKLIFKILKRGEKLKIKEAQEEMDVVDGGLRYDLTVPLARYYSNHSNELPSPFKALQIGNVWRADRPQKGRFRQQAEYIVWGSNGDMPISRPVPCLPGVFKYGNPQNRIHLTEKPLQLMRDIVKITEPGGRILDPFAGSGTTVLAAVLEGYSATGIEVTDAYAALARGRIRQALEDVQ